MFCSNCGQAAVEGARFCEACGTAIGPGVSAAPTAAAPPPARPAIPPAGPISITSADVYADSAPPPAPPTPGPPVPYTDQSPPAPRGKGRLAVAGVGAVALLAVGYVLVGNLRGTGGGADSPEGAVTGLATAISDEDALGALAMLAPEEIRSLPDVFSQAADESEDSGLVDSASSPFTGLDLEVDPADLDTTELGPGVAKVDIGGSTFSYDFEPADLTEDARDAAEGDGGESLEASSDSADLDEQYTCYDDETGELSVDTYVVTVQRGGRWYVSPTYTLAEYLLECSDLAGGDFDQSNRRDVHGADAPDAAVEELADAIARADVDGSVDLLSGGGLPVLLDYEDAIRSVINDNESYTAAVDDLSLDVEDIGSGRAKVTIESARVSYSTDDGYGDSTTGTLEVSGTCVTDTGVSTYEYEEYDDYYDDYYTSSDTDSFDDRGCLEDAFESASPDEIFVVAVEQDGEWFVSPMETALEYARVLLQEGVTDEIRSGDLLSDG